MTLRSYLAFAFSAFCVPAVATAAAPPPPFLGNCAMCHQPNGAGVPGQFPRIAGRANTIAQSSDGRTYLIEVVLNGMAGKMIVDGKPILGVMPPYARFSDGDVASVLTFVTGLPPARKVAPFTAAEIKAVRALPRRSNSQMKARRDELIAANLIP
jgi:mono/diheme cytochrome c family protein